MAKNIRTVALYVMHGRAGDAVIEYEPFLRWVSQLPKIETRIQVRSDLAFVINSSSVVDGFFVLTLVSGDPTEVPLFFNEETGEVEEGSGGRERWSARQTRVIIDANSRLVAIESRRAGVSAANLEKYFRVLARDRGYHSDLLFDLAVQPSDSFEEELDRYIRIREATVVIKRPNTDWEDAEDALADLADDSDGHAASVTVNAPRGQSLNKNRGVIRVIRSQVRRPQTSVGNVRVIGTKAGEARETTLSLARHQAKIPIEVPAGANASQERQRVIDEATSFIKATAAKIYNKIKEDAVEK